MKIVIQDSHGKASLSKEASKILIEKLGKESIKVEIYHKEEVYYPCVERHNKVFVEVIETLGNKAFGKYSNFEIVEVNEPFKIQEYDGAESIITLSEFKKDLIDPKDFD